MTDDPIDLSPLDPTRDAGTFARMSRTLAYEAMRARRRASTDLISDVARWTRPALAAALLIAVAATFALVSAGSPPTTSPITTRSSEVAGIPPLVVEWTHTNHRPSPLELVRVLDHETNDR